MTTNRKRCQLRRIPVAGDISLNNQVSPSVNSMNNRMRITAIGAGFEGLSTIHELRKLDLEAEITLVAPRAELH